MPSTPIDVLDHLVGRVDVEGGLAAPQFLEVGVAQDAELVDGTDPLGGRHAIEVGDPGAGQGSVPAGPVTAGGTPCETAAH